MISRSTPAAMIFCAPGRSSALISSMAARTVSVVTSEMLLPSTLTARLSGRSRLPPHASHGSMAMNLRYCSRICSDSVSR